MPNSNLLINKTIKQIEYIFRFMGINVKSEDKTQMDNYRSRFIYVFNFIWLSSDVAGAMLWFIEGIAQHQNFTTLTYVAPCVTMCYLSNIKAFSMVTNKSTVDTILSNLRKLEVDQAEREGDETTKKIIKVEDDYLNKVIKILNVFNIVLLISFALSPTLLILLNYYTTNEVKLLLPFLVVYPFDPYDMRYYPWVYLHQIWSEIVVVYWVCSADFLLYIFCAYLQMQFQLLKHYIEQLIPSQSRNRFDQEEMKLKLIELIKWHQQIKCSVDLLENLYTRSTLFNFISSSILICLTGFNVMAIEDIAFVLTFLCFLLMSLLQIYYLCFFGNMLMESSMAIGDAVYNSRWYLADRGLAKSMLVILTRAQTPCKLTASKFADVNLKAFMKICSTAWSYFALLQTLYTGPDK